MSRLTVFVIVGALSGTLIGHHLTGSATVAQEVESVPTPKVSEDEIQLYIDVYKAMQRDHDLTVETALVQHAMSLVEFRDLERRIQSEERLVERVRLELLDQAKALSAWGGGAATPEPPAEVEKESE